MQPSEKKHDEVLFQHLQNGDSDAFAELYRRYVKVLYNYAYRLSGSKDKAQDAVQDTFVEIWNRRESIGKIQNAKAYLLSCTRRRLTLVVQEHNFVSSLSVSESYLDLLVAEHTVEQFIITEENFRQSVYLLKSCLQELPKREYECLHLRFFEELSYEEIAQVMNITTQSARNTTGKALTKLRQHFPKSLLISLLPYVFLLIV
ncbi:RNA polymerase sigma factor [Xanthocytophaga agilis]|uniref:RNA polymerase sigma factor n=1 Tax=Xanthocytophaga agilis TaxID=3048010 RepID=A0AAE3RAB3_9BACT|nr:RNA polymerase sigma factor [Xanthocytophaga agilis]MDJ1504415.1 RNA polymerase sigma factor [Xanthocytophaga agilis]